MNAQQLLQRSLGDLAIAKNLVRPEHQQAIVEAALCLKCVLRAEAQPEPKPFTIVPHKKD